MAASTLTHDSTSRIATHTTRVLTALYPYVAGPQVVGAVPSTGNAPVWPYDVLGPWVVANVSVLFCVGNMGCSPFRTLLEPRSPKHPRLPPARTTM